MSGKILKRMPVLFLFLVCGGCALVQPTDPYRTTGIRMPSSSERAAVPPSAGQPVVPLALSQAIEIALANNPDIAAMGWDAEASIAQHDLVLGERMPSVRMLGGYAHLLGRQRLIAQRENGEQGLFGREMVAGDLVLTMPLFTGGRLINQVKAAQLLQIAATHRLTRTREEIIFNVSSVFFNILAQNRIIESLNFSRQTLQEHLKRIDALVTAGKAAKVDRMRTDVRLADITQRSLREENLKIIFHRVLVNLLGLKNPSGAISLRGEFAVTSKREIPDLEIALAKAWSSRGDFLSTGTALEAQARNVDVARAGHWPTLSLLGSYGYRWSIGETLGPDNLHNPDDIGRIGVALDFPLFEGGRVEARVRDQEAKLAAARERFRKIVLQIRLEVETALLNVNSSWERIEVTQKATEQAQESYRIERLKYDSGKGTIVDVLDAQSALLDSQTNYDRALADHNIANAQLRLAAGGEL